MTRIPTGKAAKSCPLPHFVEAAATSCHRPDLCKRMEFMASVALPC